MQCPAYDEARRMMYDEIRNIKQEYHDALSINPEDTLSRILGGNINGLDFEQMLAFWVVSGNTVNRIYREVVKGRVGIG